MKSMTVTVILLVYSLDLTHFLTLYLLNLLIMDQTKLHQLFGLLSKLPKWARAVLIFLIASILILLSLTSCASTQRIAIKIKDTPSGVSITTSQSADSSGTSINLNPTINFPRQ